MARKAFCVGINDYPYDGSDLNGCVNDATAWAELLTTQFDFPSTDVKLITDAEATKQNMLAGLDDLLAGARTGDVLVFTNSSHGSYVADTGGDEARYDEVVCPYDITANVVVDDELRERFSAVPRGVHVVAIMDNCHSGTVTRAAIAENLPGLRTPDDRRVRFLNPALRGDPVVANPWRAQPKQKEKYPESGMNEILLSGCTDIEYSYDALIDGVYHGAMTYHAIKAIREANYRLTYAQLETRLSFLVTEAGYNQHPQLEGRTANKKRQIFS
jgi:hypothetical protein